MATPISHIVYADRYLKKSNFTGDYNKFYLGVLFPDIRQVSNVNRSQTHLYFKELDLNFNGLSDFEAGWKFHSWCDLRRNEILRDHQFFDLKEINEAYYLSYYFLEDYLIWDKFDNWEAISQFLEKPPYFGVFRELSLVDWNYWFLLLSKYIKRKPDQKRIIDYCRAAPSLGIKSTRIIEEMEKLKKNNKVTLVLSQVYSEII